MPANYLKWGDWNFICDRCGFKKKASEGMKEWDNLMVCSACWEERHPQDFLRVRGDNPSVPWARPEPDDVFIYVCYIWGRSAYADLAEADCAQADFTPLSFTTLWEMKWGVPYPDIPDFYGYSAIPGYAIPGFAEPAELAIGT